MIVRWFLLSALLMCSACGYHRRDNGQPQQIAHDKSGAALTFGDLDKVEGTRFFTIPILRDDGSNGSKGGGSFSGSYRGSNERNRLIVDSTTGASRKVLPNADFEIVNWIEPTGSISDGVNDAVDVGDQSRTASGLYAAVVKRPGRTDKDPSTYDVLLGRFDDGKQVWIARGLAGVEAAWVTKDGKLAMVAAVGNQGVYRLYDPKTFGQLLETQLSL